MLHLRGCLLCKRWHLHIVYRHHLTLWCHHHGDRVAARHHKLYVLTSSWHLHTSLHGSRSARATTIESLGVGRIWWHTRTTTVVSLRHQWWRHWRWRHCGRNTGWRCVCLGGHTCCHCRHVDGVRKPIRPLLWHHVVAATLVCCVRFETSFNCTAVAVVHCRFCGFKLRRYREGISRKSIQRCTIFCFRRSNVHPSLFS